MMSQVKGILKKNFTQSDDYQSFLKAQHKHLRSQHVSSRTDRREQLTYLSTNDESKYSTSASTRSRAYSCSSTASDSESSVEVIAVNYVSGSSSSRATYAEKAPVQEHKASQPNSKIEQLAPNDRHSVAQSRTSTAALNEETEKWKTMEETSYNSTAVEEKHEESLELVGDTFHFEDEYILHVFDTKYLTRSEKATWATVLESRQTEEEQVEQAPRRPKPSGKSVLDYPEKRAQIMEKNSTDERTSRVSEDIATKSVDEEPEEDYFTRIRQQFQASFCSDDTPSSGSFIAADANHHRKMTATSAEGTGTVPTTSQHTHSIDRTAEQAATTEGFTSDWSSEGEEMIIVDPVAVDPGRERQTRKLDAPLHLNQPASMQDPAPKVAPIRLLGEATPALSRPRKPLFNDGGYTSVQQRVSHLERRSRMRSSVFGLLSRS